jgi:hypothetical protein
MAAGVVVTFLPLAVTGAAGGLAALALLSRRRPPRWRGGGPGGTATGAVRPGW